MYKKVHLNMLDGNKKFFPFIRRFMRQRYMFFPDSNSFGIHTLSNQICIYDVYGKLHGLQVEYTIKGEFTSILLCAPVLSNIYITQDFKLKIGRLFFRTDQNDQPDLTYIIRRASKMKITKLKMIECETNDNSCILSYCVIS
jgi:hypothetical protein